MDDAAYAGLFGYARASAARLMASPHRPRSARALRMTAAAAMILHYPEQPHTDPTVRTAAHDALDEMVANWPDLAFGEIDGEDVMCSRPNLWQRLMTEWPMMAYADALVSQLAQQPPSAGRILEVGCGVGNTTERLAAGYGDRLTWSDRSPLLVRQGHWAGTGRVFDFDHIPPPDLGPFHVIVATNALHCAAHIGRTLDRLKHLLEPGGLLMMAEGSSPTREDGRPWALDLLFTAFDGWWDRGGFRTRSEWTSALVAHGFVGVSHQALTEGPDDLGGVIWARRAE
jgi:2-polyprenyl-3-methyl-5-hydroxy-6-metoxy-1,4-benzoquinol methylase